MTVSNLLGILESQVFEMLLRQYYLRANDIYLSMRHRKTGIYILLFDACILLTTLNLTFNHSLRLQFIRKLNDSDI